MIETENGEENLAEAPAASADTASVIVETAAQPPARRTRRKKTEDASTEDPQATEAPEGDADQDKKPRRRSSSRKKVAESSQDTSRETAGDNSSAIETIMHEDAVAESPKRDLVKPEGASVAHARSADDGHSGFDTDESKDSSDSPQAFSGDPEKSESRQESAKRRQDRAKKGNDGKKRDKRDKHDKFDRRDNHRRQRRQHQNQNREPVVPKTTAEDLAKLKVVELRQKADELGIEHKGLLKADLVAAVLEASIKKEGFVDVEGVLDILADGYGFLRTEGYLPSEHDVYVGTSVIRRNGLRKGDYIKGQVRPARENEKFAAIQRIDTVNDVPFEELGRRPRFADLTPVYPDNRLLMEHGKSAITARVIDLAAPIGKGQRGLIVSPPKAGKTTILKDIASSISANNPEVHLMCLLVDERPEEVTDMQRSIKGEVISSTFDMPSENHIAVSELVIERAKRLVEKGEDVVILLDSITRLARAYNLAQPASGRILSGGVDSTALYPPKRFLGAARNIENGGSLTILASALIDTGSKMDEVIFEEFKGTGNMELKLDRSLADRRIFPAIDPVSSGTRKEELLLDPQEAPLIWAVRRILSNMNNTERAMDMLIKSLKQTNNNQEFLLRTAKKAQQQHGDNFEL